MGCEAAETAVEEKEKESSTPRLPLLSGPPTPTATATATATLQSPERSGTLTPPLHTHPASIPFRWELEPGKPIPCTSLVPFSNPKCLELPPSRLLIPSPTTVLDGPYVHCRGSREPRNRGGWFGSWRKRNNNNNKASFKVPAAAAGSHVFPSSADHNRDAAATISQMKRSASFSDLSRPKSRVWTKICEGLKQAVPWRSKKLKKDGGALIML